MKTFFKVIFTLFVMFSSLSLVSCNGYVGVGSVTGVYGCELAGN